MSELSHSAPAYHDPTRGDVVKCGPNTYRVVGRGVAGSVRFVRTTVGGLSLQGQKSLGCWRRLIARGSVVESGPR
jgi:hypothetical protein